ncbi:MAG TPA: RNA polymerase subunit sigma-24 [Gammaproteobacteria bacterium]|nr:RNA polymerase subunit sigma-24 [Gammaproteobacteria bacterium]
MADEKLLISRVLAGEEEAFSDLVKQYHNGMLRVASAIVGSADADDVVQDAWIKAIRALENFEGRATLKTWLTTIVANTAKSHAKKHSRWLALEDLKSDERDDLGLERFTPNGHWLNPLKVWDLGSPEAAACSEQMHQALVETLETLSHAQRMVFILHELNGMEVESICNILEITPSNARVLLHRARNKLYAAIEAMI